MKKVLITGANSYIGTSVEKYVAEHYMNECEFTTVDMIDASWREKNFSDYDVVFHVAGVVHQKETKANLESYNKINRDLVIEVASKAKREGIKQFVFLSSMSVYGMLAGRITKDTPLKPNTNYGISKLQAEEGLLQLQTDHFKVCILRPPMIYGKGCKGNYQSLRQFAHKLRIFPYVKNERSMLYIDHLSEFVRLMILNEEQGIFCPQNNEYTNTSEMIKMIAVVSGRRFHLIRGFGWAVKFLGLFIKTAKKAFGSLRYDKDLSAYYNDYAIKKLAETIEESEHV